MLTMEMLSEPVAVSDTHISGAVIEDTEDGNVRVTLYITKPSTHGGVEHRVDYVFVMSRGPALALMKAMMRGMGYSCCGAERKRTH